MFLDLKGSTDYVRSNDPEAVLMTLNQMMADWKGTKWQSISICATALWRWYVTSTMLSAR
jgi:hypothetical protein